MNEVFVFVLLTLASYRIWRFFGRDDLTERLRHKLDVRHEKAVEAGRSGERWALLSQWVSCHHCLGTWITLAVFAVASLVGDGYLSLRLPALQAVAAAAVVGLIGEWES